jgi:ribosomal protein L15
MKTVALLTGAALLAIAGPAVAQGPGPRGDRDAAVTRDQVIARVDERFALLDTNNDGRFTPEEARAMGERRRAQRADRMFDRLDLDHDGSITRDEMSQARAQRQAHRGERRADAGPGMRGHRGTRGMRGMHGMRGHHGRRGFAMGMRPGRMFGEQGFATREQFRERALARFERADANHDGTLTAEERHEARGARREHMRERLQERRDGRN